MDIGDFSISPIPLKGLHKYSLNICEIFKDVQLEICNLQKNPKIDSSKAISEFTQQLQDSFICSTAHFKDWTVS